MASQAPLPSFTPTMMATVPYREAAHCADIVLASCPQAARLPVMSGAFRWAMEGIPLIYFNREKKSIVMKPPEENEEQLLEFYDHVENDDLDYFATTAATASWYFEFLEEMQKAGLNPPWVGFQIPGPVVLGDSFKQDSGVPCIHHETMWDILVKAIAMKSRWLEKKLHEIFPQAQVICDHPEPTLINFTSAVGGGSREKLVRGVSEAFAGFGGLRWVHCCSNIDWSLLTEADIDVINFDAHQLCDKVSLQAKELNQFLERGGQLGWGIVPVQTELLDQEDAASLSERLLAGMEIFTSRGMDQALINKASWILTSCETNLLPEEKADRAFALTREVAEIVRRKMGV